MESVTVTIDGKQLQVPKTATVLEAALAAGIKIPTLCYHPELRPEGACRVCMVEVKGARSLVASCVYPVNDGMVVNTNTADVREGRKTVVELLLANHPQDCFSCARNLNCELQTIAADLGIRKIRILTNNPRKLVGLQGYGIQIVDRVSIEANPTCSNKGYLRTKRDKLGHLLEKV